MQQLEEEYQRLETAITRASPHTDAVAVDRSVQQDREHAKGEERRWGDATAAAEPFWQPPTAAAELTSAYAQLTLLKEKLWRKNLVLTNATKEHKNFQSQLGLWLEAEKVATCCVDLDTLVSNVHNQLTDVIDP